MPLIYQRWDQVPKRKHSHKHEPLDIPEMGSGAQEEYAFLQIQTPG
jgi:hypothetical protein